MVGCYGPAAPELHVVAGPNMLACDPKAGNPFADHLVQQSASRRASCAVPERAAEGALLTPRSMPFVRSRPPSQRPKTKPVRYAGLSPSAAGSRPAKRQRAAVREETAEEAVSQALFPEGEGEGDPPPLSGPVPPTRSGSSVFRLPRFACPFPACQAHDKSWADSAALRRHLANLHLRQGEVIPADVLHALDRRVCTLHRVFFSSGEPCPHCEPPGATRAPRVVPSPEEEDVTEAVLQEFASYPRTQHHIPNGAQKDFAQRNSVPCPP